MASVVIVQPYVPEYRRPFFEGVVDQLRLNGHSCLVVTGTLDARHAARGDSSSAEWHVARASRSIRVRGHHFRSYGSRRHWKNADVVVLEAAVGSLDTFLALVSPRRRPKVGLWGHISNFTGSKRGLLARVTKWQLSRSDFVFAYTDAGKLSAQRQGVPLSRVKTLGNTVRLDGLIELVNGPLLAPLPGSERFLPGKTFSYIGGIDNSKRIDFLAAALDRIWEVDAEIRVLVGGSGPNAHLLDGAVARGQVLMLGRVGDEEKARMSRQSVGLLLPGRVGLVAVESFALGLPILTTDWPFHAPEFAYLTPGVDSVVAADTVEAYADAILAYVSDAQRVQSLRDSARAKAGWPALEDMIDAFVLGCLTLIDDQESARSGGGQLRPARRWRR